MLRKRGELLDAALEAQGVSSERMDKMRFLKVAMIDAVLKNLNKYSIRDTGKPQWDASQFENVRRKTAERIAISDLITVPDMKSKVDIILKNIEES